MFSVCLKTLESLCYSVHCGISIILFCYIKWGSRYPSWLTHCSTSRKVAGSIPDGVIEIFHWRNLSIRTMALGLTQPLTEMSTRNISWGKGGRCVGLTTLPPSCAVVVWSLGTLTSWNPLGHSRPGTGLLYLYLYIKCDLKSWADF